MKGLPWFPMYTGDWLSSTPITLMTPAQEGGYVRLLIHEWEDDDCGLPDDNEKLAVLSRLGEAWLNGGSTVVRDRFVPHPTIPGKIINPRLYEEWKKSVNWREKSSEGGKKSAELRKESKGGLTTVPATVPSITHIQSQLHIQSEGQSEEDTEKDICKFSGNSNGEIPKMFEDSRQKFRDIGGKVDGSAVAWEFFIGVCKKAGIDLDGALNELLPAIQAEGRWRDETSSTGQRPPDMTHFRTWLNQRRWTQELPEVKKLETFQERKLRELYEGKEEQ